jgi:hypothetical protein
MKIGFSLQTWVDQVSVDFAIDKIRHSMVRIKSEISSRSTNQPFSEPFPTAALLLLIPSGAFSTEYGKRAAQVGSIGWLPLWFIPAG